MLQSLIGGPGYRKGSEQHLDPEIAKQWAAGGLCEIIEEKVSAKQNTNTTSKRAGKLSGGKKSS